MHPDTTEAWTEWHVGRSFGDDHHLEDTCPCPKAPCGLVQVDEADPQCPQHARGLARTMRQSHPPQNCPEKGSREALGRAEFERVRTDYGAPHWHLLSEDDRETWRAQADAWDVPA